MLISGRLNHTHQLLSYIYELIREIIVTHQKRVIIINEIDFSRFVMLGICCLVS